MSGGRLAPIAGAVVMLLAIGLPAAGQPGGCTATLAGSIATQTITDCAVTVTANATVPFGAVLELKESTIEFTDGWKLQVDGTLEATDSKFRRQAPSANLYSVFVSPTASGWLESSEVAGHSAFTLATAAFTVADSSFVDADVGLVVQGVSPVLHGLAFAEDQVGLRVLGPAASPTLVAATFENVTKHAVLAASTGETSLTFVPAGDSATDLNPAKVERAPSSTLLRASPRVVTIQGSGATGDLHALAIDASGVVRDDEVAFGQPATATLLVPSKQWTGPTAERDLGPYRIAATAGNRVNHVDDVIEGGATSVTLVIGADQDVAAPVWQPQALVHDAPRPDYSTDGVLRLQWIEPQEASGHPNRALARYEVQATRSDCPEAPDPCVFNATALREPRAELGPLAHGNWTAKVRAIDLAGNAAESNSVSVKVDRVGPTVTFTVRDQPDAPFTNRYAGTFRVELATESGAQLVVGVDGGQLVPYTVGTEPIRFDQDGNHTLLAVATDAAGNQNAITKRYTRDTAGPDLVAALSPAPALWASAPVNVTAFGRDAVAGMRQLDYRVDGGTWRSLNDTVPPPDPLVIDPLEGWRTSNGTRRLDVLPGLHTVDVRGLDRVGNPTVASMVLRYDPVAPTLRVDRPAPNGRQGWSSTPVEITATATDDASGLEHLQVRMNGGAWMDFRSPFRLATSGDHDVRLRAEDVAGNVANDTRRVRVDLDDPAPPQAVWIGGGGAILGDWSQAPAFDATSGVARLVVEQEVDGKVRTVREASTTGHGVTLDTLGAGHHRLRLRVEDIAGRSSAGPWSDVTQAAGSVGKPEAPVRAVRGLALLEPPLADGVVEVRFYVDGILVAAVGEQPFTYEWDTHAVADGHHEVLAVASSETGLLSQTVSIFEVRNGYLARAVDEPLPGATALVAGLGAVAMALALVLQARRSP